jgi:hypothetical protein
MRKKINEGFTEEGTPDLKYYAFDWDDNIVTMPTRIMVKDDNNEVIGMTTEDFAHYRNKLGKEEFEYNGHKIVGYDEDPFRNFRTEGDKAFLVDAMLAKTGPAWSDFVECVNNGSIFSIITARGHNPKTLKDGVYNYIISEFNGISKSELLKNLRKFRNFTDEKDLSDSQLIKSYLDLCRYYPVSFGTGAEANPEEEKVKALDEFVGYVRELSTKLHKKAFLKNKVSNNFVPTIGFSDDDLKNVETIKKHFEDKPDNIVQTYFTSGGKKVKY